MLPKRSLLAVAISVVAALAACSGSSSKTGDDGSGESNAGSSGTKKPTGSAGTGTGTGTTGGSGDQPTGAGGTGIVITAPPTSSSAFFQDDPPPPVCSGGTTAVVPGGTPECPDDKNLQGCPCTNVGMTASCWPGYRKNKDRGICKDGTTTCVATSGEIGGAWGPCEGAVLPDPNATTSAQMCECFSAGTWSIANIEPCFVLDGKTMKVNQAVSTCPNPITKEPVPLPTTPWSTDTLKVDCAGNFTLTFTLKAGTVASPQATDCTVASVQVVAAYTTAGVVQDLPPLPAWSTTTADEIACAADFYETGGYAELEVVGESVECDEIAQHVFTRIGYCPSSCDTNPSAPGCGSCQAGAGGTF